jgi:hypothetical protein
LRNTEFGVSLVEVALIYSQLLFCPVLLEAITFFKLSFLDNTNHGLVFEVVGPRFIWSFY